MKQQVLHISSLLLTVLLAGSCSNEDDPVDPVNNSDAVELGITAGVTLTKSAINSGTQNGTASTIMQKVAVRAVGTDYTAAKSNDKAVYAQSTGVWSRTGTVDKIMLTSSIATIYAFYPVDSYDADGNVTSTAISVTGTVGTDATIPITVFEGGEGTSGSPTQKVNSTITDADNSSGSSILSAPGDVDYLYEGSSPAPTASNGKADADVDASIDLNMKHALSMLTFRIYNDGTYANTGKLTKIKLDNKSGSVLQKGTSMTMDIQSGGITVTDPQAATFTRLIGTAGVTLTNAEGTSHRYSILVLPETAASSKSTVQVTFTIDGADYPVALPSTPIQWKAGNNYLYTAVLKGKELVIENVKVAAWGDEVGGEIVVN